MAGRLRLRRRPLRWPDLYRMGRRGLLLSLVLSLLLSGYNYFANPEASLALEFTQHVAGIETGAVGVLGIDSTDTDNDGDMDFVTAGLDGIKVYIQHDGNFEQKIIDDKRGERIQIADINGDGAEDFVVVMKEGAAAVRWYENTGDNEFTGHDIALGKNGVAAVGDINGDGAVDVVTATRDGNAEEVILRRWINSGSGTFTGTVLHSDSGVTALAIGDIGHGGYAEIVTGGDQGLQYWRTSDAITWMRADIDDDHGNKTAIALADVNGDGLTDIVTGDQHVDTVAYYRNVEGEPFVRSVISTETDATSVQVVDMDSDGNEDVVVAGQDDNSVYWFRNDGEETFSRSEIASQLQTVMVAKAVDLDNDNDFDVIAGDHYRGTVYWYERVAARPVATAPSNIKQTVDGAGRVTFDVTVSDSDFDPTRLRVQYSLDGTRWDKPWLLKVTPDTGTVDLKNSNGFQVGTRDDIDTNTKDSVKLTFLWDTKSIHNTGGPIVGDVDSVRLRVIPYDGKAVGLAAISSTFRVDNEPPAGLANLRMTEVGVDAAKLAWDKPTDSSPFTYELYYGTDYEAVLERRSEVWNAEDNEGMADFETTSTTITGLSRGTSYTFKLFVTDAFGNLAAAPSTRGSTLSAEATASPTPTPTSSDGPTPLPTATPSSLPTTTPSPSPSPTVGISPSPSPSPFFSPLIPSPVVSNTPPLADAGVDQVVNPSALVILDGTDSIDPDGDSLSFRWRQLSGPNVELLSERTATPSFSAGDEGQAYIFALTVRDESGGSATDTVTIATKNLVVDTSPVPVETDQAPEVEEEEESSSQLGVILWPLNWGLFILSALATLVSLSEQILRSMKRPVGGATMSSESVPRGRVVHYQTGEPVAGVRVLIYGEDGKLRRTETTTSRGEFPTDFPLGKYTLGVQATGFTFAPAASKAVAPEDGILYSGGALNIEERKPITIVVPMKPTGEGVGSLRTRALHLWQVLQRLSRVLSWPLFVSGAMLNTFLIFWMPSGLFLLLEVLYVALVVIKVVLEVRVRPAYGMVRDAITHVPLDLAVVRLYEQQTNRLMMTRVADSQGRFFALPPAGTYRVTVTKPGYAVFSKEAIKITDEQDSVLQMTADLMPVAPSAATARPRLTDS